VDVKRCVNNAYRSAAKISRWRPPGALASRRAGRRVGRNPKLRLQLANHAADTAIAKFEALQALGNGAEKLVTIADRQWRGRGHDGVKWSSVKAMGRGISASELWLLQQLPSGISARVSAVVKADVMIVLYMENLPKLTVCGRSATILAIILWNSSCKLSLQAVVSTAYKAGE
jgi:hypothetical protein